MEGIDDFCYEEGVFCGFISTRSFGINVNQFANLLGTVLEGGGAFIYLYNGKLEEPNLEMLSILFQMDLIEKREEGNIILINMEDEFKLKGKHNYEHRVAFYERKINELRDKGIEKIVFYSTKDHINIMHEKHKELYKYYKKLKCLCIEKQVMTVIRYIVDDLFEEEFVKLISLHNSIIIDGGKEIYKYSYFELISTSLAYLSKKQQNDEEYMKEMKRIEYFKNLGELVEGFTHDFNNILTTIIGFSQIALIRDAESQVRDYINVINKTAIDGKAMIDKVHDYVKGCINDEKSLHQINDIVNSSTSMIKYKVNSQQREKQITLVEDLRSERSIYCDEFELRQVLLNMLLNGMSAMNDKGTLTVRTYDKDESVYIEIQDTGIGMSEEVRSKIFQPFFTTKGKQGTGLGLNTSKKILDKYSAEIIVDSQIGIGTIFTIKFPKTIKALNVLEREEDYSAYGAKVLVIDDKYSVAKVIAELISLVNLTAHVETNAEKVLQRLEEDNYDIIVCDYSMPKINGIQVSEQVKERYPEKPFVLLTGYSDSINENFDTIDYVLRKPCTVDELVNALEKAFNIVAVNNIKSYNINC